MHIYTYIRIACRNTPRRSRARTRTSAPNPQDRQASHARRPASRLGRATPTSAPGPGLVPPTSALGLGLTRYAAPTSVPGLGSPRPHLRQDWAHPAHICAGTGAHPAHICAGTGLVLPTSAPAARHRAKPSPGADVIGASQGPVQMWQRKGESSSPGGMWRGEPNPRSRCGAELAHHHVPAGQELPGRSCLPAGEKMERFDHRRLHARVDLQRRRARLLQRLVGPNAENRVKTEDATFVGVTTLRF
jgi:hypothetical protein